MIWRLQRLYMPDVVERRVVVSCLRRADVPGLISTERRVDSQVDRIVRNLGEMDSLKISAIASVGHHFRSYSMKS
jgi:hypothetical protein